MSSDIVTTTFQEDMERIWGNWGVSSEIGKLRAVLVRRGGGEIDNVDDPSKWRMKELWNPEIVREQQDTLFEIYRKHGVKVFEIEEMSPDLPNGIFVRDLALMTPEGAIVTRPAVQCRSGEEMWVARHLMKLNVPILRTISSDGIFEGACLLWLDRETAFLGDGYRCNHSGFAQVEHLLQDIGVKNIIRVNIPRSQAHLDGFLAIADTNLAVTFRLITPNIVYDELLKREFKIIEVPTIDEWSRFATNFVALEPGKIVMPSGNPETRKLLEAEGIEVITVDVSEIMKANGAIHCMTAFLKRDEVPLYSV